ncbi:MAG: hypothetical protein D6674_05965 [Acidobacteria bacterium]|jgi:hypothetical protein|nr:MAG: hypothetical protein D6674_05965 [Acidobacteriota bacterium]
MVLRRVVESLKGLNLIILVLEAIILPLLVFGISFYLNPNDPFMVALPYGMLYFLIPLTVLTLHYGFVAAVIFLAVNAILLTVLYDVFPTTYFLWLVLFALIMSEFNYYWTRKIRSAEEKNRYAEGKLRDVAREYMLLKLSHDQIEKQYIVKPVSIRGVVQDIRMLIQKDKREELFGNLLALINQLYNIESSAIVEYNMITNDFNVLATSDKDIKINEEDLLIKRAIEEETITYISQLENGSSDYLAVIPVKQEDIYHLFLIQKMDFLNFNLDTLLGVNLLLYYTLIEEPLIKKANYLIESFPKLDINFLKELLRTYEIQRNIGVESSMIVLYVEGGDENFADMLRYNLRGLDLLDYTLQDKKLIIFMLLPFTSLSGAKGLVERIKHKVVETFSASFWENKVRFRLIPIDKDPKELLSSIVSAELTKA